MTVEVSFDDQNRSIRVKGELTVHTVMDALPMFERAGGEQTDWRIDLGEVTRVDSTALALLIELKRQAHSKNRSISFNGLPDALLTIARLSQVEELLNV